MTGLSDHAEPSILQGWVAPYFGHDEFDARLRRKAARCSSWSRRIELQSDAFSAATFKLESGKRIVVFNPLHDGGRTNSSIAHEFAHLLLDHSVRNVETVGNFKWVTCDSEQEEEADWLAGCLLLPRPVLYTAAKKGWSAAKVAQQYGTSEPMARFRLNASGVLIQVARQRQAMGR